MCSFIGFGFVEYDLMIVATSHETRSRSLATESCFAV